MKRILLLVLVFCFLLSGCESSLLDETEYKSEDNLNTSAKNEQEEGATVIFPLPESTMENLNDAILFISLEEGGAYVDDTGKMQMDMKIYSYDKYDMVDISIMKAGDILVTHSGEVEICSLERREDGAVLINGGLYGDGFDLVTDNSGLFYESGYNDAKSWYQVGEATIRVSVDFEYHDTSDLELGEVVYYPGSFLIGEVTNYNFTPYNTTIRVEDGQIMEMNRVYIP